MLSTRAAIRRCWPVVTRDLRRDYAGMRFIQRSRPGQDRQMHDDPDVQRRRQRAG